MQTMVPLHEVEPGEKQRKKGKTVCERRSCDDEESHKEIGEKNGFGNEGEDCLD